MDLEKWYWWTYLQGRNRDAENRLVDTEGKEEGEWNWEQQWNVYVTTWNRASGEALCNTGRSPAPWSLEDGMQVRGGREVQEEGSLYVHLLLTHAVV